MKIRSIYMFCMALCGMLLLSQNAIGQDIVKDVDITSEQAKVQLANETPSSYFVEIGGPNNYYHKQRVDFTNELSLDNFNSKGEKFGDGQYTLQITPIYELTPEQRQDLAQMREVNDQEGIAAYREANNLPETVDRFAMNFSILNGKYVIPTQKEGKLNLPTMSSKWELDHPSLYASINTVGLDYPDLTVDNSSVALDQVFVDDLIVEGSICVGFDCNNGENFGFDTHRLKENNLRIHFQDTSNSSSFPSADWRIVANDTTNGGMNYLAIEDSDNATYPFRILKGAGNNALYIDAQGDVGLNTSTPVVELHIADGDSPTMRLEQNGSSGFTAQTWDVAGNETNFFIRDVTNGSELPFKITPGAPDNLLYMKGGSHDNIGICTANPNIGSKLHIFGTSSMILPLGTDAQRPGTPVAGMLRGNTDQNIVEYYDGSSWVDLTSGGGGGSSPWTLSGGNVYRSSGRVGIGLSNPSHILTIKSTVADPNRLALIGNFEFTEGSNPSWTGLGLRLDGANRAFNFIGSWQATNTDDFTMRFGHGGGNPAMASGDKGLVNLYGTSFSPTSGTAEYSYLTLTGGINQTGGANGITRGIYINNSITAAADWRSIDIPQNVGFGIYQSGSSAKNYFAGNVGIGCTNPSSALHVVGTISTTAASVSTSIACSSDRRFKKNISPLQNSLEKVLNLQGVNYDWKIAEFPDKHFNEGRQLGFIAQEIEEVLPLVVMTDKEGYKSVDYSRLTPVLVEAIKEQQSIIDAQQQEINELQSQVASLEELKAQVAALTQMVMKQNDANSSKAQVGDE